MTKFTDGPAAGITLMLGRAPLLLRVVQTSFGAWDALDQLADKPADDEKVFVYRKVSDNGTVHVDGRDSKGKRFGRWFASATYRLNDSQPDDAAARDARLWPEWAVNEAKGGKS